MWFLIISIRTIATISAGAPTTATMAPVTHPNFQMASGATKIMIGTQMWRRLTISQPKRPNNAKTGFITRLAS